MIRLVASTCAGLEWIGAQNQLEYPFALAGALAYKFGYRRADPATTVAQHAASLTALQQTLGYSPLVTGVAFLPISAGLILASNLSTIVLMPRFGPKPLVAVGMLAASGGMVWLAQLGPHTGYATGVLGPIILAGIGLGMVIAPVINTGTFGVAPQDAGEASATVTVGQQLGASIGTALLSTIFASAVTSYIATHLATARLIGRQALTRLALTHGYDTAFWWTAGIFAGGAVGGGALLRRGPLGQGAWVKEPSPT